MFPPSIHTATTQTTSYQVILPFYVYASLSFLTACVFLFTSEEAFLQSHVHPHILAITHIMALGWATMVILGASHQLVPVLIGGKLYSETLAYVSFFLAAVGIPLLVYGFYMFNMGAPAKWGGRFVVLAILAYLINIACSMAKSRRKNVHAVFVITATFWLLVTALFGLALVYNFSYPLFSKDSLHFLSLHAHVGMMGWFLLLVMGVGSRLIPMFLISKYTNPDLLWVMYILIHAALFSYLVIFYAYAERVVIFIPFLFILVAVLLFIYYCYQAFKQRLRKQIDEQMNISLFSVLALLLPLTLLFAVNTWVLTDRYKNILIAYGFLIFFGWLTAIIFGMTFKTLPFIVWNKVYRHRLAMGAMPNPKSLFHHNVFKIMRVAYFCGLAFFCIGILASWGICLKIGAVFFIVTATLYNWNVFKAINHKAKQHEHDKQ